MNQQALDRTQLHFDLSHLGDEAFTLQSGIREYPLARHTAKSLAEARQHNRALALIPDHRITHYVDGAETPSNTPILLQVKYPSPVPGAGLPVMALTAIHIPRQTRMQGLQNRKGKRLEYARGPHAKLALYGIPEDSDDELIIDVNDIKTATDAACSLVFHHGEMATQDSTCADIVMDVIETSLGISDLAESILQQAQMYAKDPVDFTNWVSEAPLLDAWNNPIQGQYIYQWSPTTITWVRAPMCDSLQKTKNIMALEGRAWTSLVGQSSVTVSAQSSQQRRARLLGDAPATPNYTTRTVTPESGLENSDATYDPSTSEVTIQVKNHYLRWLGVTVAFFDSEGQPVPYDSNPNDLLQSLGLASGVNTILAVPLPATWDSFSFQFPEGASTAQVYFGGIGMLPWNWDQDGAGTCLTGLFDYIIPGMCIVAGVAADDEEYSAVQSATASALVSAFGQVATAPFGVALGQSNGPQTILSAFGNIAGSFLLSAMNAKGAEALSAWMTEKLAEGTAEKCVPIVGWIAQAVGIAADVAAIVETTVQVASSPATMTIEVSRTMDIQVTVLPDVNHQNQWPSTATHYTITATYSDGTARNMPGEMDPTTQEGPIVVTFSDVPAGGFVSIQAFFYSDTGWLCGKGNSQSMTALPTDGSTLVVPTFNIQEQLVPLTSTTTYNFKQKLTLDDNQDLVWTAGTTAPTDTVSSLDSGNIGQNLAKLVGLTYSQETSDIGYTWQASDQNIPIAGGGSQPYTGQMYTFQNISDGASPQDGLKFTPAGYATNPPYLTYAALSQQDGTNPKFFLEPNPTSNDYYLRVASSDPSQPFSPDPGQSMGKFVGPQDSLVIHPAGYAVGINSTYSKLQILQLSASGPVDDAVAPYAQAYAGMGTRQGLLTTPVAVAAPIDGRVLVLQTPSTDGSQPASVAAFDFKGNPVNCFAGNSTATAPMRDESLPVVYLDVSAESKGYIYVLKYLADPDKTTVDPSDYLLDIYNPDGSFLVQTSGVAAAKMVVTLWRDVYTLNYETITGSSRTQPSVSTWIPSTPS